MKTLAERLRYAMEVLPPKKIKGVELARAVGVKPPSVSDWLSGKSKTMEGENLLRASSFLCVNPSWLATGSGKPDMVASEPPAPADSSFSNVRINEKPLRRIPVLDFVQAGTFHETGYDGLNPKSETYTTYENSKPESIFALEVSGLSMTPDFNPGDKLVVDASKLAYPGCYVIAQNGCHEATFKKYRAIGYDEHGRETFELIPLNPDFPVMDSTKQEIRIIGVVVEHVRQFGK